MDVRAGVRVNGVIKGRGGMVARVVLEGTVSGSGECW